MKAEGMLATVALPSTVALTTQVKSVFCTMSKASGLDEPKFCKDSFPILVL